MSEAPNAGNANTHMATPLIEDIPPSSLANTSSYPPIDVIGDLHDPQRTRRIADLLGAASPQTTPFSAPVPRVAGPQTAPGGVPRPQRPPTANTGALRTPTGALPRVARTSGARPVPAPYRAPLTISLAQVKGRRWQALLALLGGALVVVGYFLPWLHGPGEYTAFALIRHYAHYLMIVGAVYLGFLAGCFVVIMGLGGLAHGLTPGGSRLTLFVGGLGMASFLTVGNVTSWGGRLTLLGDVVIMAASLAIYNSAAWKARSAASSAFLVSARSFALASLLLLTTLATPWLPAATARYTPLFALHSLLYLPYDRFSATSLSYRVSLLVTLGMVILLFGAVWSVSTTVLDLVRGASTLAQSRRVGGLMLLTTVCAAFALLWLALLTRAEVAQDTVAPALSRYFIHHYGVGFWVAGLAVIGMAGACVNALAVPGRTRGTGRLQP